MKNEFVMTWKLYRSWLYEGLLKGRGLFFLVTWTIFGILMVKLALDGWLTTFYIFMAGYCFYRAFFRRIVLLKKQYNAFAKSYGQKDWIRTIVFGEDEIVLSEGNITVNYKYGDITGIREKEDKIWIDFQNKSVLRLYKSSFVDTTWEECKAEIERLRLLERK